jgi:hypothetical protein
MEKLTLFKTHSEKTPYIPPDVFHGASTRFNLESLFIAIRKGEIYDMQWRDTIAMLRNASTKEERSRIKNGLPAVLVTGLYENRTQMIEASGLMVIDIDRDAQKKGWDLHGTMDAMKSYGKYFRIVSLSPSGNDYGGIKIIVEHMHPPEQHKQVFNLIAREIEQTFDVIVDKSGSDITRLMYLTHDVNAWMYEGYPFQTKNTMAYRNEALINGIDEETVSKFETKKKEQSKGNRITLDFICNAVKQYEIDITNQYEDWLRIGFALAFEFGEHGRDAFHCLSKQYHKYDESECDAKYDEALKNHSGRVAFGSLIHIAKTHGIDVGKRQITGDETGDVISFWHWRGERIRIDEVDLYRFFKSQGIALMRIGVRDAGGVPSPLILVEITNNVVKRIDASKLRNLVKIYLDSISMDDNALHEIRNAVSKGASTLFSEDKWVLHLDVMEQPDFLRETKDVGYIFFQNTYVEITKDSCKEKQYTEANGYVWDEWRKPKPFRIMHPEDYQHGDWYRMLKFICTENHASDLDGNRFDALRWSLGCLMHNPKTTAEKTYIHFCSDNNTNDSSNGGTGTTILTFFSLRHVRKIDTVPYTSGLTKGRSSFPYQNISPSTQVIHFGDVDKQYLRNDFAEDMKGITTDGIQTERKGKNGNYIPPEELPRMVGTGNAVPFVNDESSKRRFYLMEIYSRFNASYTPVHEFGRRFFEDEWNGDDWAMFFNTMIECIQFYIANPERPKYESETLHINQFDTNTHPEWRVFIEHSIEQYAYQFRKDEDDENGISGVYILHNEFKTHRIHDDDVLIYMNSSDDLFTEFRRWCMEHGARFDSVSHRDIKQWMALTPPMLDLRIGTFTHTHVSKKISKYRGKTYHMIFGRAKDSSELKH